MIVSPSGLAARYKQQGKGPHWTRRRVVAFDDDWQALVISDDHRLEYASRYGNLDGYRPRQPRCSRLHRDYARWRLAHRVHQQRRVEFDEPLVGWAPRNGSVTPLTVDADGLVDDMDSYSGEYRIYHPEQREIPAAAETGPESPQ